MVISASGENSFGQVPWRQNFWYNAARSLPPERPVCVYIVFFMHKAVPMCLCFMGFLVLLRDIPGS